MRARFDHPPHLPHRRHLEPELPDLAASIGFLSRDLARVYSDHKVGRARVVLSQRHEEVAGVADRIAAARRTCDELRRRPTEIESEAHRPDPDLPA